jgi:uncharacterized membrane protein YcaP (DUF421 family)
MSSLRRALRAIDHPRLVLDQGWLEGMQFSSAEPAPVTLEGEPVLLVADGSVMERNLRRRRMTCDELRAEARLAQVASLDDVRYAVLETNGRVSFITRD